MRPLQFFLPFCLACLPAGLVHAETAAAATGAVPAASVVAPAITVSSVERRVLRDRVIASGLVAAIENVQVAPLIEGQPIEALLADVGDVVEAGQTLAVLSKTTLELQKSQLNASLASARATMAQAEAQMLEARSAADEAQRVSERTSALRQQGTASQAAADTAQSNAIAATARVTVAVQSLEAARAQIALVEAQMANIDLQLSRSEVKAPVSGEIAGRNARVGSVASAAGEPMFTIIRDNALEVLADVAEADLMRLEPGQSATLRLVGSQPPLKGTLRLVEPTIGTQTRLGRVRIAVDDSHAVRAGMYVEADIRVTEHEVNAVPVTAVGSGPDGTSVMRVRDGAVERVPVTIGIRDAGWVEVLSGLEAGDVVVTKAGAFVRDGDRINPVPATN
ncbi:efflux RND transporter periplasmic adaptor subunit [Pseudorhodobacter sp. MZDSW-24AT]|uniref:efflux RND transporter periplasmic adaptor subunit n=1 Tax=Pseudorhodobacter sp. MZDSW-24AT TaxID=2052957 RepID=UPI000C1E1A16|nr:efflux RND transporter periplasmic adaptor subunit [Pseudorhodobacter sp. MZDSW-24AT]PJF09932.1 efflux RND transporter periplasmic adaptor subunit [Pseudorhodobacter sp. MZDSW-24AT]